MFGAVVKSYYAKKLGKKPEDMYVVSIMPCTAKKTECARPELSNDGVPNVDADYAYEYGIYVHRDDYEKAQALLF